LLRFVEGAWKRKIKKYVLKRYPVAILPEEMVRLSGCGSSRFKDPNFSLKSRVNFPLLIKRLGDVASITFSSDIHRSAEEGRLILTSSHIVGLEAG
jgi:hypothetical protein